MTRKNVFQQVGNQRKTNAQVQEDALRANQRPAIQEAQDTAESAKALPPVGASFRYWGTEDPPGGILMIEDGRQLAVIDYLDLFGIIGTTHNQPGDVEGTFRIPDSRNRSGIGADSIRPVGTKRGSETVQLTEGQMPEHYHNIDIYDDTHFHDGDDSRTFTIVDNVQLSGGGTRIVPTDPQFSVSTVSSETHDHNAFIYDAGNDEAHPNVHPVIHVNYVIRVKP